MTVDSHQHFWCFDKVRHTWISDQMHVLRMDFMPEDLLPSLEKEGVEGCISVQADQSELETNFLLGLADQHDFIQGVVGWLDIRSPDFPHRLEHYSQFKKLKGLRHVVQNENDVNFLLREEFNRGVTHLQEFDLRYDILVHPHQLGAVLEFVHKLPDQLFVIDHLAKPYIKDGFFHGWATMMKAISRCENVYCKISGFLTEADWQSWKYNDFVKYFDCILESFGTDRIMYGSDWPVCLLAAEYSQVIQVVRKFVRSLSEDEQADIMGKTALGFYQING